MRGRSRPYAVTTKAVAGARYDAAHNSKWAVMRKLTTRTILIISGAALALPLVYFAFLTINIVWETHRVDRLCAALKPGTSLVNVEPAIRKYWLWNGLVAYQFEHPDRGSPGTFDEKQQTWNIGVPAVSTMGDMECFITHNGTIVTATQVMGP